MSWRERIDAIIHHLHLCRVRPGRTFCDYFERWLSE